MLDAAAGAASAGAFWAEYAAALLPPPGALTLPLVLADAALAALQDDAVASAALAQRERLAGLLPELAAAAPPLAWGFAVVRSRAFTLGGDAFGCVPFFDLANHAADPSADLLQPFDDAGNPTDPSAPPCMRLVARRALPQGAEVTICYSGADAGYSNARFMAQHGFVPAGGNRAERVAFAEGEGTARPLCLEWLQAALGDNAWMDMITGADPSLYAALSSLPTSNAAAEDTAAARAAQRAAVATLAAEAAAAAAAAPTSAAQDAAALAQAEAAGEEHLAAAVRYRLERKRLWGRCGAVLAQYDAWLAAR
jgi:hypothetical protein